MVRRRSDNAITGRAASSCRFATRFCLQNWHMVFCFPLLGPDLIGENWEASFETEQRRHLHVIGGPASREAALKALPQGSSPLLTRALFPMSLNGAIPCTK